MPIYLYWGDDDFSLAKAVETLRESVLDPSWATFNCDKILPEHPNPVIFGLNQAMTPPFGFGSRLVWLVNTSVTQQCPPEVLQELERTLPAIPETTILLLTTQSKPDGRLKATKILQKQAKVVQEFSRIPPWKTEQLIQRVQEVAQQLQVKLTIAAIEQLAESVGNDTRQLYNELEKLKLYRGTSDKPLGVDAIAQLVQSQTQNSLKLANAIKAGNTDLALGLINDLIGRNEPALRIVATLVGQFRTWLWVRLMMQQGIKDEAEIAKVAEVANPKRIYFLKKEVQSLSVQQLQQTLPLLLELEVNLKRGADQASTLQTQVIKLCCLFQAIIR